MNYSEIIRTLDQATTFDLYRLYAAIGNMLDDPRRLAEIRKRLRPGDLVEVFDPDRNGVRPARILKIQRTRVRVEHVDDGRCFLYPFYMLNLHKVDTGIVDNRRTVGLSRNELSLGDQVGFQTRDGRELYGEVIKLNPKTAKIRVVEMVWRVDYSLLFKVLEPGQAEFLPARRD